MKLDPSPSVNSVQAENGLVLQMFASQSFLPASNLFFLKYIHARKFEPRDSFSGHELLALYKRSRVDILLVQNAADAAGSTAFVHLFGPLNRHNIRIFRDEYQEFRRTSTFGMFG